MVMRIQPLFSCRRGVIACATIVMMSLCCSAEDAQTGAQPLAFEKDILPIFRTRCFSCHTGKNAKAGLDLSNHRAVLKGGDSGPAIRRSAAESSLIWEKIAGGKMPPKGPQLTAKQKGMIRVWINEGAHGKADSAKLDATASEYSISDDERDFWSF
jgi:uncharacterized membrane protein